jgi:hypothetical protein
MKKIVLVAAILLSGCAAKLTFIDRSNGTVHLGTTGNTLDKSGVANATIDNVSFSGPWVYSQNGGSYSLGTGVINGNANGTVSGAGGAAFVNANSNQTIVTSNFVSSAQGNGLINLRAADGAFIRCVFTFNSMSNTGIGQCVKNDGREFDLTVTRQ